MDSSRQRTNGSHGEVIFSWMVMVLFGVSIAIGSLKHFRPGSIDLLSWEGSDWLINYEGGFVRRGIIGQVLFELEKLHLFDVRVAIMLICAVFSVTVLCILVRIFRREGWSLLIIPTGLCLGYTFLNIWGRRDLLSLTMTFFIFMSYRNAVSRSRQWPWWSTFYGLSILQILIHEASFFYTFPILMLHSFHRQRTRQLSIAASTVRCLLLFLPVLVTMAIVCLFKGDQQTAETIWASWGKVLGTFQPQAVDGMGKSVEALAWDARETFGNHLYTSYLGCFHPSLWGIPLTLFNLLATYYLLTRANSVKTGIYPQRSMSHATMSDIVLVQFIALLPMYTVLSCDWGRTLPYLVISSVFFYHLFKQEAPLFSRHLNRLSTRMQDAISALKPLNLPAVYILLVLLTPIPRYHVPFDTVNTFQQKFWTEILHYINH